MKAWNENILKVSQEVSDDSFIGGTPKLPMGTVLPVCSLCGHEYCIPELPKGPLSQAHLPEGFWDRYQRNFRVFVFDTAEGVPFDGCRPCIPFQRLEWIPGARSDKDAPPQADAFSPTGKSPFPWYDLFARDQIYFWGTAGGGEPDVYISVQCS